MARPPCTGSPWGTLQANRTFQVKASHRAIMAGQVKHKQIFSSIRPDWRLAKLLLSLGYA